MVAGKLAEDSSSANAKNYQLHSDLLFVNNIKQALLAETDAGLLLLTKY
jgi:hypothetical protein